MRYLRRITTEVFQMRKRSGLTNYSSNCKYWHLAQHAHRCEFILDAQSLTDASSLDIDIFDSPDGEIWSATNSTTAVTATGITRITVNAPFGPSLFFRAQVKAGKSAEFVGYAHWTFFERPPYLFVVDLRGRGDTVEAGLEGFGEGSQMPGIGVEGMMRDIRRNRPRWAHYRFM